MGLSHRRLDVLYKTNILYFVSLKFESYKSEANVVDEFV